MPENNNTTLDPNVEARFAQMEEALASMQKENEFLKKSLSKKETPAAPEKKEKPKTPDKTFTVDGKEYKFLVPVFRILNKERQPVDMTAVDALTDKDVLQALVYNKSGVIAEVE